MASGPTWGLFGVVSVRLCQFYFDYNLQTSTCSKISSQKTPSNIWPPLSTSLVVWWHTNSIQTCITDFRGAFNWSACLSPFPATLLLTYSFTLLYLPFHQSRLNLDEVLLPSLLLTFGIDSLLTCDVHLHLTLVNVNWNPSLYPISHLASKDPTPLFFSTMWALEIALLLLLKPMSYWEIIRSHRYVSIHNSLPIHP